MKVLVFGASGATGRRIVAEAERRGHEVVAFVRGELGADEAGSRQIVRGDATSPRDVEGAIAKGCDVVISALGARSLKKTRLLETAVKAIVETMQRNRLARLIELSAAGTFGMPKASRISFRERIAFELLRRSVLRNSFADHAVADQIIHQSELSWTIVQPPELDDGPAQGYQISLDGLLRGGSISRVDVAAAIIDIMETGSFIHQSPFVCRPPA